jgi:hypothetical protein
MGHVNEILVMRFGSEADDVQRGEMLSGVGRLLERDRRLTLDHKPIEILRQQYGNGFGQSSHHPRLNLSDFVENTQGTVLKDRISIQY